MVKNNSHRLAAELREIIAVQRKITVQDESTGAFSEYWRTLFTCSAGVSYKSAAERYTERSDRPKASVTFTVRACEATKDVDVSDRVMFDGALCNIISVDKSEARDGVIRFETEYIGVNHE